MAPLDSGSALGRRIGLVFLLIGVLVTVGGGIWLARTAVFVARADQVPGRIIAIEQGSGSKGRTLYRPVFRYADASGAVHERRAAMSASGLTLKVGDAVTIAHEHADPAQARIVSFEMLWMGPLFVFGFGTLFTGFAALCLRLWARAA